MNKNILTKFLFLFSIFLYYIKYAECSEKINKIPYLTALNNSDISQYVENKSQYPFVLGNGDLIAFVGIHNKKLLIKIYKNDIDDWRLKGLSINNNRGSHSFCAVSLDLDLKELGLSVNNKKNHLKLIDGTLEIAGKLLINVLAHTNVLIIRGDSYILKKIKLEIPNKDLEKKNRKNNNISSLIVNLKKDKFWSGMSYNCSHTQINNNLLVNVSTTFETDEIDEYGFYFLEELIDEGLGDLPQKNKRYWQNYWSVSGIRIDDKDMEKIWYRSLYYSKVFFSASLFPLKSQIGNFYDRKLQKQNYSNINDYVTAFNSWFQSNHLYLLDSYSLFLNNSISSLEKIAIEEKYKGIKLPNFLFGNPSSYKMTDYIKEQINYSKEHSKNNQVITSLAIIPLIKRGRYSEDWEYIQNEVYPILIRQIKQICYDIDNNFSKFNALNLYCAYYLLKKFHSYSKLFRMDKSIREEFVEQTIKKIEKEKYKNKFFSNIYPKSPIDLIRYKKYSNTFKDNLISGTFNLVNLSIADKIHKKFISEENSVIHLFPGAKKNEYLAFKNFRVPGGFLISSAYNNTKISQIEINSTYEGTIKIKSPWEKIGIIKNSNKIEEIKSNKKGILNLEMGDGKKIALIPIKN